MLVLVVVGAPLFERPTIDVVVDKHAPADRLLYHGFADAVTVDHGKVGRLGAGKGDFYTIFFKTVF